MILAVDTHYTGDRAHTVGILFEAWTDARPSQVISAWREGIAAYEPGQFYKRELPCILDLFLQVDLSQLEAIVIDGFVVLDDAGSPGLGAHLYHALEGRVPVIGVAKTNYATIHTAKAEVLRGDSARPLNITATGIDLAKAAGHIHAMHGAFRLPDLLKELDRRTKEPGS